jgi:hypothetical protein
MQQGRELSADAKPVMARRSRWRASGRETNHMRNRFRGSMILVATAAAVALPSLVVRSTAGQRPAPAYRATRTVDGKPNLDGIWQALNTANWDIQTHAARPALAVVPGAGPSDHVPAAPALALGAMAGVPGGLGVVEGNEIPIRRGRRRKRRRTSSTRSPATRKSNVSCRVCHAPRTCRIPFRLSRVRTRS